MRDRTPYLWKDSLIKNGKQRKRHIGDFTFYFKDDSVVMEYKDTYTLYHAFNEKYKPRFRAFQNRIYKKLSKDTITIEKVWGLAKTYNVKSTQASALSTLSMDFEKTEWDLKASAVRVMKGEKYDK